MIDAKSYMKQLRVIDQRILRNTEEIEKLRALWLVQVELDAEEMDGGGDA